MRKIHKSLAIGASSVLFVTSTAFLLHAIWHGTTEESSSDTEYRALVAKAVKAGKTNINARLNSITSLQFAITMEEMFRRAQHRVCIDTDHLARNGQLSQQRPLKNFGNQSWAHSYVIRGAQRFLSRPDSCLDIIVRYGLDVPNSNPDKHPLLATLIGDPTRKGTISLRIMNLPADSDNPVAQHPEDYIAVDQAVSRKEVDGVMARFGDYKEARNFDMAFNRAVAVIDTYATETGDALAVAYSPKAHDPKHPDRFYGPSGEINWRQFCITPAGLN